MLVIGEEESGRPGVGLVVALTLQPNTNLPITIIYSPPPKKNPSLSFSSFQSVCRPFFLKKKNSYKDVAAASAAAEVMGDSVLLLSHIIQQTHFSLSEMSRSYIRYDQKTDDLSVVTCHFGYFKQRQHTNTHTHTRTQREKLTASSIAQARTFVLSLSTREWHLEKWWKMDLCPV